MLEGSGILIFDPENKTKKHALQSSWKTVALIQTDCDIHAYYSWFIEKRYNLKLNQPLRGSHVTILSDMIGRDSINENPIEIYEKVKKEFEGKVMNFKYDPNVRTNGEHWWLKVTCEEAENFRERIGLKRDPYWGFHLTLGLPNNKTIEHSYYIWGLIKKGFIKT